ncbi:MAG TPA: hypothetical protein VM580_25610 [Labilithrix sp.]|nr:hypothetical protein [Labilithrix sp.]
MYRRHSVELVALVIGIAACERRSTPRSDVSPSSTVALSSSRPTDGEPVASADVPVEAPSLAGPDAGEGEGNAGTTAALGCTEIGLPKAGRSIGHTSVVFKLELPNRKKAVFKPDARKVRGRYKGEIAAFRLARALGIDNVPTVCAHAFDASVVASALAANAEASKLFAAEAVVEQGRVYGAIIPWIDGLQFWPLEKGSVRSEVRRWLAAGGEIPPTKAELARQASMLVTFDFLTGNWDRYSGGNVGLDKSGRNVLFIDNDAAFVEPLPKGFATKSRATLDATDRFSRSLVERIRALDEERLTSVFGQEAPGRPLLSAGVVSLVARRAKDLTAVVDAKVRAHGETETLYFR